MTEVPKVSPLAPAPSRGQARDDYSATADAFAASLPPMVDQINEVAEFVNDAVQFIEDSNPSGFAEQAEQSAIRAEASKSQAEVIAAAVQSASGLPSLGGNDGKALVVDGDKVAWGYANSLRRKELTSDYLLSGTDSGSILEFSGSADASLKFPPASELPDGWYCWVKNSSNSDLLIGEEVFGSEQIENSEFSDDILGVNVVVNGDFSTGDHWSSSGGWSISAGVAVATSAAGNLTANAPPLEVGEWYAVTYTVLSVTAGSVRVNLGTRAGAEVSVPGTFTEVLQCAGSGDLFFSKGSSNFSGSVDSLVVRPFGSLVSTGAVGMTPNDWSYVSGSGTVVFGDSTMSVSGVSGRLMKYKYPFSAGDYTVALSCSLPSGSSVQVSLGGKTVSVSLPAGVTSGTVAIPFSGNPAGDLYLTFSGSPSVSNLRVLGTNRLPVVSGGNLEVWPGVVVFSKPTQSSISDVWDLAADIIEVSGGQLSLGLQGVSSVSLLSATAVNLRYSALAEVSVSLRSAGYCKVGRLSVRRVLSDTNAPDRDKVLYPWRMFSKEVRIFYSDGSLVRSLIVSPFSKTFYSSVFILTPPGYTAIEGVIVDGGAGATKTRSYHTYYNPPVTGYTSVAGAGGKAYQVHVGCRDGLALTLSVGAGGGKQITSVTYTESTNYSTIVVAGYAPGSTTLSAFDFRSLEQASVVTALFSGESGKVSENPAAVPPLE